LAPLAGTNGVVLVTLTASDGSFSTNTVFPLLVVPSTNVLFNDHFDYTNGPITSNSAGMWLHHSGQVPGEAMTTNGELLVSRSLTEDVNAPLIGEPYDTDSAAALYSRFKVRFTDLPAAGGNYYAHFKSATNSLFARVWASTANAAPGTFRLGIGNGGTSDPSTAQFPLDLQIGTNYTVVTCLVFSNGYSTIWIDPVSETDTSATATDALSGASGVRVSAYAFREDASEGIMLVDDLVVGTSFAAVTGRSPSASTPLRIEPIGNGNVRLSWTNPPSITFTLWSAPAVTGTFNNIPNATSPYICPLTGSRRFFILR
jgi:hypothetical protein